MSFSGIRLDAALPMASYAVDLGGPYSSLGDMRLGAMMPLMDMKEGWPGMAVQAVAWLPTGDEERWSGSQDQPVVLFLVLLKRISSYWGWSANAGARIAVVTLFAMSNRVLVTLVGLKFTIPLILEGSLGLKRFRKAQLDFPKSLLNLVLACVCSLPNGLSKH